jgi:hypothetical protein
MIRNIFHCLLLTYRLTAVSLAPPPRLGASGRLRPDILIPNTGLDGGCNQSLYLV